MNKLSIASNSHNSRPAQNSVEMRSIALVKPQPAIETHIREILIQLGEDPDREGLQRTPHRVAKMYGEMLEGYTQNLEVIVNGALFEADYGAGEMVVVADIEYNSMCEHHMLPFIGKVHKVEPLKNNRTQLVQTAFFAPKGLSLASCTGICSTLFTVSFSPG